MKLIANLMRKLKSTHILIKLNKCNNTRITTLFLVQYTLISFEYWYYNGVLIYRTSKGNGNWFEKSGGGGVTGFDGEKWKRVLVQVIGSFEKWGLQEIETPLCSTHPPGYFYCRT